GGLDHRALIIVALHLDDVRAVFRVGVLFRLGGVVRDWGARVPGVGDRAVLFDLLLCDLLIRGRRQRDFELVVDIDGDEAFGWDGGAGDRDLHLLLHVGAVCGLKERERGARRDRGPRYGPGNPRSAGRHRVVLRALDDPGAEDELLVRRERP